ncbi:MAG: energy transducer TonB [Vicinamibacteria bacterium]
MTPRMFQDLVTSSAVRPSRGRGRALPLSLAVHGAVFAAIAAVPLLREPDLVEAASPPSYSALVAPPVIAVVTPPAAPPRVRPPVTRNTAPAAPRAPLTAGSSGSAPALPSDVSLLGTGDPKADGTPVCLYDCEPGRTVGVSLGTGLVEGDGSATVDPGPPRRAGIDVTPPLRISGAQPAYPELGKAVRTGGRVVIECTIDPRGRVVNAVITRGHPLFDAAALDAVRTWVYRPTLIDGVPVPVLMTVTVNFTLR